MTSATCAASFERGVSRTMTGALLFALVGPPVGCVLFIAALGVGSGGLGLLFAGGIALIDPLRLLATAYLTGAVPAAITGALVAAMFERVGPVVLQTSAMLTGALSSVAMLAAQARHPSETTGLASLMAFAGAATAALLTAGVVRGVHRRRARAHVAARRAGRRALRPRFHR